jgi:hypothetical protein
MKSFWVALFSLFFFALAAQTVRAQDNVLWPKMLGPEDPTDPPRRTIDGVTIFVQGLDKGGGQKSNGKPKIREKYLVRLTPNWLADHQVNDQFQEDFLEEGSKILHESGYVETTVTEESRAVKQSWIDCGEVQVAGTTRKVTYAQVAREYNLSQLQIRFTDEPVWIPQIGQWAASVNDSQYQIRVTILAGDHMFSDPEHATLRRPGPSTRWEVGNDFGRLAGLNYEVGDRSPCAPQ